MAAPDIVIKDSNRRRSYSAKAVHDRIIHGDSFNVLPKLPPETYDLVFMDPPYFLQLPKKELRRWKVKTTVDAVDDHWDKFASFEDYDDYIARLLAGVRPLMKEKATIWVISTYHSVFRIGKIMQDLGFWILNDVHWVKRNPMPNWLGVRFTNATETLIWAVRDKNVKGYTFHKDKAKELGVGKVGANVWELPICAGKERLRDSEGNKTHSTQKPLALLRNVVLTSTNEGDLVLDPVGGTGTTAAASKELGRHFTVIERDAAYVEAAEQRLSKLKAP